MTIRIETTLLDGRWQAQLDDTSAPLTATSLSHLKRLISAATAARHHVSPTRIDVQLSARLPDLYATLWAHSQGQALVARTAAAEAAATRRAVIRNLTSDGVSGPDIATLLNLSPGRIYQLLNESPTPIQGHADDVKP